MSNNFSHSLSHARVGGGNTSAKSIWDIQNAGVRDTEKAYCRFSGYRKPEEYISGWSAVFRCVLWLGGGVQSQTIRFPSEDRSGFQCHFIYFPTACPLRSGTADAICCYMFTSIVKKRKKKQQNVRGQNVAVLIIRMRNERCSVRLRFQSFVCTYEGIIWSLL